MPDSRNRYRASKLAHSVSAFLNAFGLKTEVRLPGPHKRLTEVFAAEPDLAALERSTLVGLQNFSVSTRADTHLDLSGALNAAEQNAAPGKIGVVVQQRRSPAPANTFFVVLSLESFAKVARIIEGVDHD